MIAIRLPNGAECWCETVAEAAALLGLQSVDPPAVALGRAGGRKGGPARAAALTPEERTESAQNAARARWENPEQTQAPASPVQSPDPAPEEEHSDVEIPDWFPVITHANKKTLGVQAALAAAFQRDVAFSLPRLATYIYGDSKPESMRLLKKNLVNCEAQGVLQRIGANSYRVIKAPTGAS